MDCQKYLDKRIAIQNSILLFIDGEKDIQANYQNLVRNLQDPELLKDRQEFKEILYLISKITNNHHRTPDFFNQIKQVISIIKDDIKKSFSDFDLFQIFRSNKRLLLFLHKQNLLSFNEEIIQYISTERFIKQNYFGYFFPEIDGLLDNSMYEQYSEEHNRILEKFNKSVELFERNRQIGENDSQICQLIRDDSFEEFIRYVNQEKIDLSSQIQPSIFETNSLLLKQTPTLIEYAAFFGALKITKYLFRHGVELTPSLWIYATHSRNPKMMHFLEKHNVKQNVQQFMDESLKCHHFEITDEIINNSLNNMKKGDKNVFARSIKYMNFVYFPDDFKTLNAFYYLCKFDFVKIVEMILNDKEIEVSMLNGILNILYFQIKFQNIYVSNPVFKNNEF